MQKARSHPTRGLLPLVSAWFQVLLTPLLGVLFTFPSQYLFTIGLSETKKDVVSCDKLWGAAYKL